MPAKSRTKTSDFPYSIHPSVTMLQEWIALLPQKTGRSLDQWLVLVKKDGPATTKERVDWLKDAHKMGTNSASWIAERAEGKGAEHEDPETYLRSAVKFVEEMYAGSKTGLKPLYERLLELRQSVSKDIKVCPCKTIVPLYRNHVIAQIKPTTRTRIDFGYALKDTKATGRLIDTGGYAKKDRITHRIPISNLDDIDDEVKRWLKVAYDMDA
jgi:hypothetical protein